MNLFELTKERLELQSKLQALNLDEQTIQDTLEGESTEIQLKIESYGFVIKEMESFAEAMKAEETRMTDRRKAQEKKVEKIKEWLLINMQACGINKIECPAFTIAVRQNPAKIVIDNENQIPDEFMFTPLPSPPEPAKKAIAEAIKAGKEVPGCHIEHGYMVEIK